MAEPLVAIAGATGQLGEATALALRKRDVATKALVRPGTAAERTAKLREAGVVVVEVDLGDVAAVTRELAGVTCVVSTLQGLRDVLHDVQGGLLDAAVAAGVRRFIPSDFSLDFTKTAPGGNRNSDVRREFHARLDAAAAAGSSSSIECTSIMCGGFMDMMGGPNGPINDSWHRVIHLGSADQLVDITTVHDIAAFTAAVAVDPRPTPRKLCVAGDVISAKGMAEVATRVRGATYSTLSIASVGFMRWVISFLRLFGGENNIFPVWQMLQYMADSFSGEAKIDSLDNDRYPDIKYTTLEEFLRQFDAEHPKRK